MSAIELNEKLLMDAGGWQAMKQARALFEAGRVAGATYEAPLLKGMVSDAGKDFRAGLRITGRTSIENMCSCRAAREWGTICAHALAVGLAVIKTPRPQSAPLPFETKKAVDAGPKFTVTEDKPDLALHVILPPNFEAAWEKRELMFCFEADSTGRRLPLNALRPQGFFRVNAADFRVLEKIRTINEGDLAGMLILPQQKSRELIELLRGHPHVTFGKTKAVDVDALLDSLPSPTASVTVPATTAVNDLPAPKFFLEIEGSLNHLSARLQADYDGRAHFIGARDEGSRRNFVAEQAALDRLAKSGFAGADAKGWTTLRSETAVLRFFAQDLPRLQKEWIVSIGPRFSNITAEVERITPRLDIQRSGENWFDLSFHLEAGEGQSFSASEIQGLLRSGQSHVRLKNNRVAVFDAAMLDDFQNVLRDCEPRQLQPGVYRVDRMHAGYIDAAVGGETQITGAAGWKEWARAQRKVEAIEPIPLGSLETVLRQYQKQGVYWMSFLARNGFGGILADEMGLGKTLQALAFLRTQSSPSLIVCPSSLVYNWQREAERFTPELKTLVLTGPDRESLFRKIPESDLVITSYPLLRRDAERYREVDFAAAILDEAQHIKNPETQNAQAALQLRARSRFALSGTPMENSVRDLWSLMHFLLPGYLGTKQDFRERYEVPISTNDASAQGRLGKRIRPFFLRRLKKEVATELPEKIEQVVYCELNAGQRQTYNSILAQCSAQIGQASEENQRRMLMLTGLLRLRQACCDLRLLSSSETKKLPTAAKVELLEEVLREAIDGGHRVLIFSQFVKMLHVLQEHLNRISILFCYLDGSTKDRGAEVDRFQNDPEIPVFLISLKAGGVGLNLTAADTVIHFDPWWNPATEAQATDRAHRIGQSKVVTTLKLIARGTVEEKILHLQRKKRALSEGMLESEEPLTTGLTTEELSSLIL